MISSAGDVVMSNLAYERLHHNLQVMKLAIIDSILDNFLEIAVFADPKMTPCADPILTHYMS